MEEVSHKNPDPQPSRWRSRLRRLRQKMAKPPSTALTIVLGIAVIFLASVVGSVSAYLTREITGVTDEIPFYTFVAGGAGLGVGLLSAWLGTRLYYGLVEAKRRLEHELIQERMARLDLTAQNLDRLDLYSSHIYSILEALVVEELSLHDPVSEDTKSAICDIPAEQMHEATERSFIISIWGEPADSANFFGRAAELVRENMPERVSEPVASSLIGAKFKILAGANTRDAKAFSVRIASSWLKHHQIKETDEPAPNEPNGSSAIPRRSKDLERFIYRADHPFDHLDERDIKAFEEQQYRAVRAFSFRRPNGIYYVVALSKMDGAFTQAEELYLLWLKRVLELDAVIHVGPGDVRPMATDVQQRADS